MTGLAQRKVGDKSQNINVITKINSILTHKILHILVYLKVIFDREEKVARLNKQCPPKGTQHTHIKFSLFLMGGGGCIRITK